MSLALGRSLSRDQIDHEMQRMIAAILIVLDGDGVKIPEDVFLAARGKTVQMGRDEQGFVLFLEDR
jgi:hypothetical protein